MDEPIVRIDRSFIDSYGHDYVDPKLNKKVFNDIILIGKQSGMYKHSDEGLIKYAIEQAIKLTSFNHLEFEDNYEMIMSTLLS